VVLSTKLGQDIRDKKVYLHLLISCKAVN